MPTRGASGSIPTMPQAWRIPALIRRMGAVTPTRWVRSPSARGVSWPPLPAGRPWCWPKPRVGQRLDHRPGPSVGPGFLQQVCVDICVCRDGGGAAVGHGQLCPLRAQGPHRCRPPPPRRPPTAPGGPGHASRLARKVADFTALNTACSARPPPGSHVPAGRYSRAAPRRCRGRAWVPHSRSAAPLPAPARAR